MERELRYIKECLDKMLKYNELGENESVRKLALSARNETIGLLVNPPKREKRLSFWERMCTSEYTD